MVQLLPQNIDYETLQDLSRMLLLHARGSMHWEVILRTEDDHQHWQLHQQELEAWLQTLPFEVQQYLHKKMAICLRSNISFAGLTKDQPLIAGIINVTPDSFSDSGENMDTDTAIATGLAMMAEGADILDIGGESTKPGAEPVGQDLELQRVAPVVKGLVEAGAIVSVDTRKAAVMQACIDQGAQIINDVSALSDDDASLDVIASNPHISVILMHKKGQPKTMQQDVSYQNILMDIYDYLLERIELCETAGIAKERICVDVGIGFGKSLQHNLDLLGRMSLFQSLGCPVMLGASRKSFIALVSRDALPKERMAGSIAAALSGAAQGVGILRVHDVKATKQALDVYSAIEKSSY